MYTHINIDTPNQCPHRLLSTNTMKVIHITMPTEASRACPAPGVEVYIGDGDVTDGFGLEGVPGVEVGFSDEQSRLLLVTVVSH